MMPYTVSVVVPVWNAEKFLPMTLDSILAQTYPLKRIFVVNDRSTDKTPDILSKYEQKYPDKVIVINLPENKGPANARNVGVGHALDRPVDFIAFCDSDDVWDKNKIAEQIKIFDGSDDKNLGSVYCANDVIDEDNNRTDASSSPVHRGNIHHEVAAGSAIHGSMSSLIVKPRVFAKVGYFDASIDMDEDLDFLIRISKQYAFDFSDNVLVSLRRHPGNRSMDFKKLLRSKSYIINKYTPYYEEHRHLIRKLRLDIIKDIWIKEYSNDQFSLFNLFFIRHLWEKFNTYQKYFDGYAREVMFFKTKRAFYKWCFKYILNRIRRKL